MPFFVDLKTCGFFWQPFRVRTFINSVTNTPLENIDVPLARFSWEYEKVSSIRSGNQLSLFQITLFWSDPAPLQELGFYLMYFWSLLSSGLLVSSGQLSATTIHSTAVKWGMTFSLCLDPQGDFYHWVDLLNHFESYFEKYVKPRKDLQLDFDCLEEDYQFPKEPVLQILRVTRIVLENCANKYLYNSNEVSGHLPTSRYLLGTSMHEKIRLAACRFRSEGDIYVLAWEDFPGWQRPSLEDARCLTCHMSSSALCRDWQMRFLYEARVNFTRGLVSLWESYWLSDPWCSTCQHCLPALTLK